MRQIEQCEMVYKWLQECTEPDRNGGTAAADLYKAFEQWLARRTLVPIIRTTFTYALNKYGFPKVSRYENWKDMRPLRLNPNWEA